MRAKNKVSAFSVKIIAEIFGTDDILVNEIKFAETVEGRNLTQAFKKVQKRIKRKAARRGYKVRHDYNAKDGYRVQYCLYSPFRKLWEKSSLN